MTAQGAGTRPPTRARPPVTIVAHEVGTSGGMETQLGRLVSGLLARGHEITVVARRCEVPAQPGLRWIRVRGPARPFALGFSWFFLAGSVAAHRGRRGLLHTTGALVANRADVATIHFCHRAFARTRLSRTDRRALHYRLNAALVGWLSHVAEALVYRRAHTRHAVGVSLGVATEIRALFPGLHGVVSTIPNGVDLERYRPDATARAEVRAELGVAHDALVAMFVGAEWERKGLRAAIEALAAAPRWSLLVVGSGDAERFGRVAVEAGVASRVQFVGPRADAPRFFAAGDAFVLPTAYETFSMATFEAAACGLPILNTRVHGVEELLVEGVNGWFIERDAATVARRLRQLETGEVRSKMATAARTSADRFTWGPVVEAYGALYERLDDDQP